MVESHLKWKTISIGEQSVYEMTMRTEVKNMTGGQKRKYDKRNPGLVEHPRAIMGGFTKKVLFAEGHSHVDKQWISFHLKDKTPVIYGTSCA